MAFYHFESYNSVISVLLHILNTEKETDKFYLNYLSLNVCILLYILFYLVEIVIKNKFLHLFSFKGFMIYY